MESRPLTFGLFMLDRERRMLTRDGEPIPVSHRGYTLLEALLDAGGEPVRKQVLMERAWPGAAIEEGNLTVQISALRRQLGDKAEAIIVTVPRVGYRLVRQAEPRRTDRAGLPLIAVVPFANQGSLVEDGYFADGVVDDIITALSRFRTFAVVARGSTFALREQRSEDVSALGVDYALGGSIRRMGDRLRVTAQLSDARSGTHLWAERYEGAVADIFSFQDSITESVVGVVEPAIRKAEIERARRKPASSLDAYDLFLRALPSFHNARTDGHAETIALLTQSAERDPGFALAPAYAAWVYERRHSMQGIAAAEMMRGNYEAAIEWCMKSLATFNDWFYTCITLATSYAMLDLMDEAHEMIRRILEEHPSLTSRSSRTAPTTRTSSPGRSCPASGRRDCRRASRSP